MMMLYVAAGINHFVNPGFYLKIIPPYISSPEVINYISGAAEILLGLLLVARATRRLAAWGIIILLIAIFPANIQMLINYIRESNPKTWIAVARLPVQILLIWWAYIFTQKPFEIQQTEK